jgi:hypothetical protein
MAPDQPPPLDRHRSIHLALGPGGVFVIDSKQYRDRLQLDPSGRLWHGRYPLAPTLRAASREADQAAQVLPVPGMAVVPIVAVHGARSPGARWSPTACRSCPPGGARTRAGRLASRPGLGLLPRRRLILTACRGGSPPPTCAGSPCALPHRTAHGTERTTTVTHASPVSWLSQLSRHELGTRQS